MSASSGPGGTTVDTGPDLEVGGEPEDVLALFEERGWGDGLPLVPPTAGRVAAMVGDRDPDEVLGVLAPRFGAATRRTVAVNAVLAGCPPAVMPVVEAAVRALARPEMNLRGFNATTHPVAPLVIVHGEIVGRAGFNAGLGLFGPGNRANATVGRAVRLVLLHVAGGYPGRGDASTQGQPAKYTYCIAENAPESPWGGYASSVGIDAPSAVTVHAGENPHNVHDMESDAPWRILDKVASAMSSLGMNNACIAQGELFVALCPEHAATIAGAGWARRDVSSYLYERARLPARLFRRHFDTLAWRPWMAGMPDTDLEGRPSLLPMTGHPDNVRVLVAGGAGKHSCVIPSWGMTRSVTLAVDS